MGVLLFQCLLKLTLVSEVCCYLYNLKLHLDANDSPWELVQITVYVFVKMWLYFSYYGMEWVN